MNGIKLENHSEPATPRSVDEASYVDDNGEFIIPKDLSRVWLARVPKYLWEALSGVEEDDPIQVGVVKVWNDNNGQKMKFRLASDWHQRQEDLPKDYDLRITQMQPVNTFLFSEKDLPGYRPPGNGRFKSDYLTVPAGADSVRSGKIMKRGKSKRSIPKHTTLAGIPIHELSCLPVENAEFQRIMHRRSLKALHRAEIARATDADINVIGDLDIGNSFSNFIKTGEASKSGGRRPQENKAARIPQNELLDRLYTCFKQYKYWSLKSLKTETHQPEVYLKDTLQKIATLVKSGPFSMTWTLNPESSQSTYADYALKEEEAPELAAASGSDEENLEMEDAI